MAYRTFAARFPVRKLHKKSTFKKKRTSRLARPAGRGQKGISRREP